MQKEVHPEFGPGLLEGDRIVKIQSDNHFHTVISRLFV